MTPCQTNRKTTKPNIVDQLIGIDLALITVLYMFEGSFLGVGTVGKLRTVRNQDSTGST